MSKRTKRKILWLTAGILGLIILTACSSATEEAAPIAKSPEVVQPTKDSTGEATEEAKTAQASEQAEEEEAAQATVVAQATQEAEAKEVARATEEAEEAKATDEAQAIEEAGVSSDEADNEPTATTESPSEEAPADGIFTDDSRTERQRIISDDWNTDWNRHTVPYSELLALLPARDGIPAIDEPVYISSEEAAEWLAPQEPVIAFENNGDARAYPLQIMTYHEIVNDEVGGDPVTVTFCPLCNSAIVFDRRLNGEVYDFGTSGWLRNSDLVMYDRNTESLWQQFTGEGIVGEMAGEQLAFLPSLMVSFADFQEAFPEGVILSRQTGHNRPYGQNPYPGYDRIGENPFAFAGVPDGRLAAMERVIAVSLDETDIAYPLKLLADEGVINDNQVGQDLVLFHTGGTASALDSPLILMGADVGATGVFDPNLNGEKLTFSKDGDSIVDEQTGSSWNILGQAVNGPLAGEVLAPLVHGDHFWFAWAAFKPDTIIFGS